MILSLGLDLLLSFESELPLTLQGYTTLSRACFSQERLTVIMLSLVRVQACP